MSEQNQTPSAPATVCDDGLDLRKFSSLRPMEQLESLESDFRATVAYEKGMRRAEAELKVSRMKEVTL